MPTQYIHVKALVCPSCSNVKEFGLATGFPPTGWHTWIGCLFVCDVCGETNTIKEEYIVKDVTAMPDYYTPTTQKAKGIYLLKSICGYSKPLQGTPLLVYGIFPVAKAIPWQLLALVTSQYKKIFARPCPPSPEHGFVESRVINTAEELEALRQETIKANPASEIILTQLIDAEANAVWTPHCLAIGPGHDGATAGKNAVTLPLMGQSTFDRETLDKAGIAPDAGPFIEAVRTKLPKGNGHWIYTQLRGGPAEKVALDFLPGTRTCAKVIKTNGEDLLEWAAVVKKLKDDPGVFVWHPGGSVVDHYSVHCRCNGVPIFTTKEPQVGMTYDAAESVPHSASAMAAGIAAGEMLNNRGGKDGQVALALLALHNSDAMRGPASFWIGAGAAMLCKLGLAALEAEGRHAHNCYAGMTHKPDIYAYYNSKTLSFARARLSRITQLLTYGWGDPDHHTGGFGGPKWGLCGAALTPVFNAMRKILLDPDDSHCAELIGAMNIAINQAHNGGWWLNKFIAAQAYDEIPKGNVLYALQAGDAAFELSKLDKAEIKAHLAKLKKAAARWPAETRIAPLRWRKAALDITPGSFTLRLKASTVPTPREITIHLTDEIKANLLKQFGRIKIAPGKIDLVLKGGQTVNVWTEKPLAVEARKKTTTGTWVPANAS